MQMTTFRFYLLSRKVTNWFPSSPVINFLPEQRCLTWTGTELHFFIFFSVFPVCSHMRHECEKLGGSWEAQQLPLVWKWESMNKFKSLSWNLLISVEGRQMTDWNGAQAECGGITKADPVLLDWHFKWTFPRLIVMKYLTKAGVSRCPCQNRAAGHARCCSTELHWDWEICLVRTQAAYFSPDRVLNISFGLHSDCHQGDFPDPDYSL